MTAASASDGLAFIDPVCVVMAIDGLEVRITPLVFADLPKVLKEVLPVLASLQTNGPGFFERLKTKTLSLEEVSGLLTSLAVNGEQYINLVALLSRQSPEWVGNLMVDRAAKLMLACLEVNADFFSKALPMVVAMAAQHGAGAAAAPTETGSATKMPSSSS